MNRGSRGRQIRRKGREEGTTKRDDRTEQSREREDGKRAA